MPARKYKSMTTDLPVKKRRDLKRFYSSFDFEDADRRPKGHVYAWQEKRERAVVAAWARKRLDGDAPSL